MNRHFVRTLAAIVLINLLTLVASAKDKKPSSAPNYIAPTAVDFLKILPEPPAEGSDALKQDIDTLLKLQESRTDAEVARCKTEGHVSVYNFFTPTLGEWFKADDLPATTAFFTKVGQDNSAIVSAAKDHWKRPRPPSTDNRIHSIFTEKSWSYPSGHTTSATVFSLILCEIFPEKKDELIKRGEEGGWDRAIAGIHFPSDVIAGRTLGKEIAKKMLAEPKFLADLEKVKAELKKAAKAHASATHEMEPALAGR